MLNLYRMGVAKSSSHHLSQFEIGGDKPCSQDLSEKVRLAETLSGLLPSGPLYVQLGLPCAVGWNTCLPLLTETKGDSLGYRGHWA